MHHLQFMQEAIRLSRQGMCSGEGGHFGCVIVKDGVIVGKGNNRVLADNDPTAHAEIVAIRNACKHLQAHQLTGCAVYASCEPCPMCLSAFYWARPAIVYYANTHEDAAAIGFDDKIIYQELEKSRLQRSLPMQCIGREEALPVFKEWVLKGNKNLY